MAEDKPYEILWGEHHVGFVRMAVRHGYTIVPVATVGTEDVVKPVMDLPIREVLTAGGTDISGGCEVGGGRREVYFRLGPLLHTEHLRGQEEDDQLLRNLRDVTKQRVQEGIDWLLQHRESDPERFVFRQNSAASPPQRLSTSKPQSQKMLMMPPKLSIEKVFAEMKAIAHVSGKDSQKSKKEKIQKLLVASRGEEAKFIVRMLQAKLRIGIQIPTLLQALAYAFTLTLPGTGSGAKVTDRRHPPQGTKKAPSAGELEAQMIAMEAAVRQAFSEMPNFDNLIKALMEGRRSLLEVCHISLGVPVKPMLAKPSKGIAEVGERLSGKRFTGEWKYDGERAQIHVLSRETIQIYSRNSENMTEKYPDVIQVVKDTLAEERGDGRLRWTTRLASCWLIRIGDVQSCIIDSELVAYDQVNKKILPFQVLTTRGRKNIHVEDIKVNVCLFAFDCMLVNGKPLVKEPLELRREKLWTMLRPVEGKVTFAVHKNFDDINEEEIQAFLDESVAGSCEGLMLKTLTENATYEPSKRSLNWLKLKKDRGIVERDTPRCVAYVGPREKEVILNTGYAPNSPEVNQDYLEGMADSIDVVPIGAYYGKGKRSGAYGAYLLAIYDQENEEFQTVCKAGTGFSDEEKSKFTHYKFFKEHLRGSAETNYNVNDKLKPDVWLEPCQVWEIRAADLSISPVHTSAFGVKADGKGIGLRFPRFLRIRDDKTAEDRPGIDPRFPVKHVLPVKLQLMVFILSPRALSKSSRCLRPKPRLVALDTLTMIFKSGDMRVQHAQGGRSLESSGVRTLCSYAQLKEKRLQRAESRQADQHKSIRHQPICQKVFGGSRPQFLPSYGVSKVERASPGRTSPRCKAASKAKSGPASPRPGLAAAVHQPAPPAQQRTLNQLAGRLGDKEQRVMQVMNEQMEELRSLRKQVGEDHPPRGPRDRKDVPPRGGREVSEADPAEPGELLSLGGEERGSKAHAPGGSSHIFHSELRVRWNSREAQRGGAEKQLKRTRQVGSQAKPQTHHCRLPGAAVSPPRSRDARDTRPEPSDWQPCMHCGKSFRPAGMERHVKVCQNIMQNDAKRHSRELRLKAQASDRAPEKMLSKASAELKAPKAAELPTEVPDSVPMIFGGPGGCEPGSPLWSLEGPAPEALTPSRQDVDQWEKAVEEAIHAMSEPGTSAPATTPTAPTAPPPPDINALTFVSTLPLPAGTFQEPPAGHTLEDSVEDAHSNGRKTWCFPMTNGENSKLLTTSSWQLAFPLAFLFDGVLHNKSWDVP
eukprot:g27472.t1